MDQTTDTNDKAETNTTDNKNPLRQEWFLTLQSIAPEMTDEKKLVQFIDMMFNLAIGRRRDAIEQPIFQREKIHRFTVLCTAMKQLGKAMQQQPFTDLLGEVHQLIRSQKGQKDTGSFYTPTDICDLMVAITDKGEADAKFAKGEVITLSDPAVGAGRLFLAFAKRHKTHLDLIRFLAMDIELTAVKMCFLNCFFNKIALRIFHGNTITKDIWDVHETPAWLAYEGNHYLVELGELIRANEEMKAKE